MPAAIPPSPERVALAQNLAISLQTRLAGEESNLWKFNAGLSIAKALEISRDPNESRSAAQLIRQSLESAPPDTAPEVLSALRSLIEIFESGRRTLETPNLIAKSLATLFRSK